MTLFMTRYKARSVDYRVINIVKDLVIDCRWLDSIYRCVPGESNATCELRFFIFYDYYSAVYRLRFPLCRCLP